MQVEAGTGLDAFAGTFRCFGAVQHHHIDPFISPQLAELRMIRLAGK